MASGCQLYLAIPAGFPGDLSLIEAALEAGRAPSLLVTGKAEAARLQAIQAAAHRRNAAVLIENDYALARALELDGVHLLDRTISLQAAREALGAGAAIGVECSLSRHVAMILGEAGADYVAFGRGGAGETAEPDNLESMVRWWSALFEIPCAAHVPANAAEETWRKLVAAGADFIIPGSELWDNPGTVVKTVERLASYCG